MHKNEISMRTLKVRLRASKVMEEETYSGGTTSNSARVWKKTGCMALKILSWICLMSCCDEISKILWKLIKSLSPWEYLQNHSGRGWKAPLVMALVHLGQSKVRWSRLLRAVLTISGGGDSTSSLATWSLLAIKKLLLVSSWNFLYFHLCPLLLVLLPDADEEKCGLVLLTPFHQVFTRSSRMSPLQARQSQLSQLFLLRQMLQSSGALL